MIVWRAFSLTLKVGYMLMESPLWMPVRSTCSIMPGMNTFFPSQTASVSSSRPSMYLSTSTGSSSLSSTAVRR